MTSKQAFDLHVEASLDNLQEIRAFVDQAGQKLGVKESVLADLRLVVDEAVTNIVLHGYGGRGGPVRVQLEKEGEDIITRLKDRAPAFDAEGISDPQLDTQLTERPVGGMGLFLIDKMTDECRFRVLPGGGNELELVKRGAIDPRRSG